MKGNFCADRHNKASAEQVPNHNDHVHQPIKSHADFTEKMHSQSDHVLWNFLSYQSQERNPIILFAIMTSHTSGRIKHFLSAFNVSPASTKRRITTQYLLTCKSPSCACIAVMNLKTVPSVI